MTSRRALISTAVTAAFLLPASPGFAQDGVTFDPGSPTGKEYAIPLEEARRNASTDRNTLEATQQRGERSAPLFGEGIGDDSSGGGGAGGTNGNGGANGDGGSGGGESSGSAIVDRSLSATNTLRAAAPDGGAQSALMIGGLALALLVLGGVIGSIARRRTG